MDTLAELNKLQYKEWLEESYQVSVDVVYNGIKYGSKPTDAYLDRAYNILRRRIAIGGYRLANTISDLYENYLREKEKSLKEDQFLIMLE
jgi:hypothetical protein